MLNYVWLGLLVISLVTASINDKVGDVGKAAISGAETAVSIAIGLIGVMALWLGIMKIAEKAGLINLLARAIKPVTKRLFKEVPPEHPAMGAMLLNIAANWLGLGNAATPFGIKAMEELQTLNPSDDTASDAQVLFLTINTASITFIPASVIAVRVSAGSTDPFSIIGTAIFASATATVVGITVTLLLSKLPVFRKTSPTVAEDV